MAIRGGAKPLSWLMGMPMTAIGNDTYTFVFSDMQGPVEWRPFLDDIQGALGPTCHVSPGQTVDVFPRFTARNGLVQTLIAGFHSINMNNTRPIYAYLPASYFENTAATYPVVYMQDGLGNWNVDVAFDAAAASGACSARGLAGWSGQRPGVKPETCVSDSDCPSGQCRTFPEAIVIGVASTTERLQEYTPTKDPRGGVGGGGDLYLRMLTQELKPVIDSALRTRTDASSTVLAGSSLGGLITAYAGTRQPDVFGLLAILSPSTWWNDDVIVSDVTTRSMLPGPLRVYLDSAQGSADGEAATNALAAAYVQLGYVEGVNLRHVVQPGAKHDATFWAQRFPGAMQFLLGEQ